MTEQIAKPAEPPAPQSGRAGGSQPRRGRSPVLESARVLVVDALPANRGAIIRFCRWAGMQHVREADSGADCTRLIEEFDPSIVIVGTRLTDTDCLALCQTIRSNPASFNLPVLVHASIESDDQWNDLIEAGVTDVLVKPINPGECVARVRLHVEKQALVQQLQKFRRRVESELNAARRMQMGLVPSKKRLAELEGKFDLRLQAHFEPSEELGGDYWDYFTLGKGRLGILNVDFSGHGIAAAINTFRLHTLIERIQPRGYRPSVWLSMINEALKPLLPIGQFATALYGIIDPVNQTFRFSSAGAPPVFVRGPDGIELCPLAS